MDPKSDIGPAAEAIVDAFARHFLEHGLETHDPTDLYDTKYGRLARKLWARHRPIGLLLAAPLAAADTIAPNLSRKNIAKRIHPICLAHVGLGYSNIGDLDVQRRHEYRSLVSATVESLEQCAVRTKNGLGWGINANWQTKTAEIPANTPCHTQTGYVFELFDRQSSWTEDQGRIEILHRIAAHTAFDYPEFKEPTTGALTTGYSIRDSRPVTNAASYRALILIRAYEIFGEAAFLEKGLDSLTYVTRAQNSDGSWFYSPEERFVDGYHTCFILKNLWKTKRVLEQRDETKGWVLALQDSIERGYTYYCRCLLDDGRPVPFAIAHRPVLYTLDSYDLAEGLNLLAMFGHFGTARKMMDLLEHRLLRRDGLVRFRYYPWLSWAVKGPTYHRYANTALFLALTEVLVKVREVVYENQ